jgi:hypothetical protein
VGIQSRGAPDDRNPDLAAGWQADRVVTRVTQPEEMKVKVSADVLPAIEPRETSDAT